MKEKLKKQAIAIILGALGSLISAVIATLVGPDVALNVTPVDGVVGTAAAWLSSVYA